MSTCIAISLNQITRLITNILSKIRDSSNAGDTAKVWENNVEEISNNNTNTNDNNTPVITILKDKDTGKCFFHNLQILQVNCYSLKIESYVNKGFMTLQMKLTKGRHILRKSDLKHLLLSLSFFTYSSIG